MSRKITYFYGMNFLAHIYLSGNNNMVALGNFIADGIKGKRYKKFPVEMQIGILLHRQIDSFTDSHQTFRKSTKRLHSKYGHYSGVIVDILYDHFLAKNWDRYCDVSLEDYADHFYDFLQSNYDILPERIKRMMPYMIADNWLLSYADTQGIAKVLSGMNRRTRNRSHMDEAIVELKDFYDEFEEEFTEFFDDLIKFARIKRHEIQNKLQPNSNE